MHFLSATGFIIACVSQALASPVPKEPTAAELAAINANLHTEYGNLIAEKDACVAVSACSIMRAVRFLVYLLLSSS